MKKFFELWMHKIVFRNHKTFMFFLIATPILPITILLVNFEKEKFLSDKFYMSIILFTILLFLIIIPFFIKIIRNARKDAENFDYIKYINCSVKAYKLFNQSDKKNFYKTILNAIREKDLKYIPNNKHNSLYNLFLEEVNEGRFKDQILYELDFERFEDEISKHKEKKWIREIFWYKYAFRTAIKITLGKIPKQLNKDEIKKIKLVIANNINLSENGVELNKKSLKDDIDKVLVGELKSSKEQVSNNYNLIISDKILNNLYLGLRRYDFINENNTSRKDFINTLLLDWGDHKSTISLEMNNPQTQLFLNSLNEYLDIKIPLTQIELSKKIENKNGLIKANNIYASVSKSKSTSISPKQGDLLIQIVKSAKKG